MKRYSKILVPLFALFEILAIFLAAYFAFYFHHTIEIRWNSLHETLLILSVLIWPIISSGTGYYRDRRTWSSVKLWTHLTLQWLFISFVLFVYLVLAKSDISRFSFSLFLALGYIFLGISLRIRYLFLKQIRSRGMNQRTIVFIGQEKQYRKFKAWSIENLSFGYRIVGFVDLTLSDAMVNPIKEAERLLGSGSFEEIIIGSFEHRRTILTELVDIAEEHGCRVRIIHEKEDIYTRQLGLNQFGLYKVFSVREEPLSNIPAKLFKRSFDVIFSLLVLILLYWWVHILVFIAIKTTSKGPVYFKQKRIGRGGREFCCYKYRTMAPNGSTVEGEGEITRESDERITPVGKFLRQTNIDELPQFINVLRGDMSVIGPRPHMIQEDHDVAQRLKKYRIRRFVRPGISGWAQVNGLRGGTEDMKLMQKRVDYDIHYIESWTPFLDIKIVYHTVLQMITGNTGAH